MLSCRPDNTWHMGTRSNESIRSSSRRFPRHGSCACEAHQMAPSGCQELDGADRSFRQHRHDAEFELKRQETDRQGGRAKRWRCERASEGPWTIQRTLAMSGGQAQMRNHVSRAGEQYRAHACLRGRSGQRHQPLVIQQTRALSSCARAPTAMGACQPTCQLTSACRLQRISPGAE